MDAPSMTKDTTQIGEFVLTQSTPLPELQSTLTLWQHLPTKACVLHIQNDDPENLFCLSFRTLPEDSKGVAHILEHTVLCGSQKYPVKDPFFAMTRRSLNTYMNALTGSDFTCYPAASQVEKDFYNLLEVYLDAVFFPNLQELSFRQEGHRLEFEIPDDENSPLQYKGIVFNEMKGALASADRRLWQATMAALFPDVPYCHESGGEPREIPSLSYQELLDFHKTYYHPSRCLYYFYGNLPTAQHLQFLEEKVLNGANCLPPLPPIPLQPSFKQAKTIQGTYPASPGDDKEGKTLAAMAWVMCPILEQEEVLALQVLDIALMGHDGAPLKEALLRSGLCKQVDLFMDSEINQVPCVLAFKGCCASKIEDLYQLTEKTLQQIAEDGVPLSALEGAIHQLELSRSEIASNYGPFGLTLFMRAALLQQHGADPLSGLRLFKLFENLRTRCQQPHFIKELIQRYFLKNSHRVYLHLLPDETLLDKEKEAEESALAKIKQNLNAEQKKSIIVAAADLREFQEKQEGIDLEVLPKVSLKDVSAQIKDYPLIQKQEAQTTIYTHECFTNHILYTDLAFDLPLTELQHLPLMRLCASFLPEVGAAGRSWQQHLQYVQENTGGIDCSLSLLHKVEDPLSFIPQLTVGGKALYRKVDPLFDILTQTLTTPNFCDARRIKELLLQHLESLENSLHQRPLKYAFNLCSSRFGPSGHIAMLWSGLEYIKAVKKFYKNFQENNDSMMNALQEMGCFILNKGKLDLIVSCDSEMRHLLQDKQKPLSSLPLEPNKSHIDIPMLQKRGPLGYQIPSSVAYVVSAISIPGAIHPDTPALAIACRLFENKILHKKIREQGGAYGSGATPHPSKGYLTFFSYRDPNISSTLKAFEEAAHSIARGQFDLRELEEAKLCILQDDDAPIPPSSRAMAAYCWRKAGLTQEVRQHYRTALLTCTKKHIQEAVENHVVSGLKQAQVVIFAGADLFKKEEGSLKTRGVALDFISPISDQS